MILTDKNTICNRYIRGKIGQYKKKKAELIKINKPIKGVKIRRWFHPFLIKALHVKSILLGQSYEFISKERVTVKDKPVIYAITHIGKLDYEMVVEACDIFAYPFMGDWELMYATIEDYFLRANGVLYIDTSDKEDRKNSLKYMIKALKQGVSMLIYPEGIWNLTENLPIMKLFPGTVRAAKECEVPVVPIAIEQIGKHFVINVGEELNFTNVEECKANEILRDTLATLRWNIWEYLPQEKRRSIAKKEYESFLRERIAEYAGFSLELIEGRRYRDKLDRELLDMKVDLEKLRM